LLVAKICCNAHLSRDSTSQITDCKRFELIGSRHEIG
jgi:hypothetical protein